MPHPFEVEFIGLRAVPGNNCAWETAWRYNPPPPQPGIAAALWNSVFPPVGTQYFNLTTIDLSESKCVGKCEPRIEVNAPNATWTLGTATEYLCQVRVVSETKITSNCVNVRLELGVWRVRLGVQPITTSGTSATWGGVVAPGSFVLNAGQAAAVQKFVKIQVCCVDNDEADAESAPDDAEEPEIVQGEDVDEDCHTRCRLIRPRRAIS